MAAAHATAERMPPPAPSTSLFPSQSMASHFGYPFAVVEDDEPVVEPPPQAIGVLPAHEAAADEIRSKAITVASTLHTRTTLPKMEAAMEGLLVISRTALRLHSDMGDHLAEVRP